MIAIIEAAGKQYLVKEGDKITTNKIKNITLGDSIIFDKVLLLADFATSSGQAKFEAGRPYIAGAKVKGKILKETKKKTTLIGFKSKTRQKKKQGYKSYFHKIEITKISQS